MTTINEILTIDLQEDIKHVIDLEDRSETEIQQEIESYIVTEGIGQELYDFLSKYTSNIKETGVWISGFYGSGKSYFGKMLGYILANPTINGTPARDRFIPRLKGVKDESLIENQIRKLASVDSRVVLLDVAKQNTERGLAFTLFANFLRNLGLRDDVYGYMEFDLILDGEYGEFKKKVEELQGEAWDEVKKSNRRVAKVMREVFKEMGYSEAEYEDTRDVYSSAIASFSATKFKDELEKYIQSNPDETIVFIFDEASEAIGQNKIDLLELEGISEALSSITRRVWTIAIAQEKLDDVINNSNINRSQLTKVTDRFKTKIHLEAREVDVIIRNRLLEKEEKYFKQLLGYYKKNDGLVSDITNLKSSYPTKTKSDQDFATYYPFHKYQFELLQKFLFSSNALVATQIAARGMIITTFDVLRKQMRERNLFKFAPGHAICTEAQPAPPADLINKYDSAGKIIAGKDIDLNGEKLLKTIHLFSESEMVPPTVENITKSYISDIDKYYDVKPAIEEALQILVDANVVLVTNNNYKITSDLEGKLLEEMNEYPVELFNKKRFLIKQLRDDKLFHPVDTLIDGSENFPFRVVSDQGDELSGSSRSHLKLVVYSLYNISEHRGDFVEQIKVETQQQKDTITLIPDNDQFARIDTLIGDIIRYQYMEEKYATDSDPKKRQIINNFGMMREEKEKDLRNRLERAYKNASLVYLFDEHLLSEDTFKSTINEVQRKLVKNIYTKRLPNQLSEKLVPKIFRESKENLHQLFAGGEFRFFDEHGNFVGDHLKVVEEIRAKIDSRYVDGDSLESELSGPPWGYDFGTIVTTLAVLFRAGRLSVKYSGQPWFSYQDQKVQEAFTNATKFKSAAFKSVTATLTAAQKQQAVQILLDLEANEHIDLKVDWNINDFQLADAIRVLANQYLGTLSTLRETVENFDELFKGVAQQKQTLQEYSGKVTEGNYLDKVEFLLDTKDQYNEAVQEIVKAQKFIKRKFPRAREYKRFVGAVSAELNKADKADPVIQESTQEFLRLYNEDMVNNYPQIQEQAQTIKDHYFKLLKNASEGMSHQYRKLEGKVEAALKDLKKEYPDEFNEQNLRRLKNLKEYCAARIVDEPRLEFSIDDKNTGYSLSDVLNYTALAPTKENKLLMIQSEFVKEKPDKKEDPKPRLIKFRLPGRQMKVREYKKLLTEQLSHLVGVSDEREIELAIDIEE